MPFSAIHSEAATEFMELLLKLFTGTVHMFGFCDEPHVLNQRDASGLQSLLAADISFAVGEQQLMFIELNFERHAWVQHRDAAAAIVQ